ncbi:MAG TPA: dihydropteroate synthase [Gemmatimonadales bacterium]|nr:dihydropteroate synthase [Gemmatimonadales bacterium]
MRVTPLAAASREAVRAALRAGGFDDWKADAAAQGTEPAALLLSGLDAAVREALVAYAGGKLGLDILTTADGALISGSRARLQALARPWVGPPELAEVAFQVGLALPVELPAAWTIATGTIDLDRPVVVGILNITPDSFSDGGTLPTVDAAMARAAELLEGGAAALDVGGESTRPGRREPVPAEEEIARVVPVVAGLRRRWPEVPVLVDTVKAPTARAALEAGAAAINDVSALRLDPGMAGAVAAAGAGIVLMHSRGDLAALASYVHADYGGDVVGGVLDELRQAIERAQVAGIPSERIVVDPGLGFSKTIPQNILLADQLSALHALGRPILVGPSRKRFLGAIAGREVGDRDRATAGFCAMMYARGARLFRVHDAAAVRDALAVAHAIGAAS